MQAFTGSNSVNNNANPVNQNSGKFAANPNSGLAADEYISVDLNDHIQEYDNPLLAYDNVSWKAKLYTMSTNDLRQFQDNSSARVQQYVLSETGVTGKYSIDFVEITTLPPGTNMTKNSTAMKFTIKMSEVSGMRLFDDLQLASSKLGYNQFSDLPMILEMSFVGFNTNTNTPEVIPNCTKTWGIRFQNIQARLENAGSVTVYTMDFTPNMFMMPPSEWRLNQQVEVIAGATVGSFIKEFQEKLNSVWDSQYGYLTQLFADRIKPDNYVTFKVHPKIAEMAIISDSVQDASTDRNSTEQGTKKYSLAPDSTIGNVVDFVMDSALTEHDNQGSMKRQFAHVIPISNYVGFDIFRNKHVYRYDIYITPYSTMDYQDVTDVKTKNSLKDLTDLLKDAHKSQKLNMKRYDFQWSGRNTEILDLKYNFDSQYVMATSRNVAGAYDKYNRSGEKISQLKVQDPITAGRLYQMYHRKKELESSKSRSTADNAELVKINRNFAKASEINIEGESSQMQAPSYVNSSDTQYIEDIQDSTFESLSYRDGNLGIINPPIDYRNMNAGTSGTDDSNATQTEITKRTIRTNYYGRAFLMQISMTVVGDPYWLGGSEFENKKNLNTLTTTGTLEKQSSGSYVMDSLQYEPSFLLNLYTPKGVDSETVIATQEEDSVLAQSVYRVMGIVNKFDKGGFVQHLEGALITRSLNKG